MARGRRSLGGSAGKSPAMNVRFPRAVVDQIDARSARLGVDRSVVVRELVEAGLMATDSEETAAVKQS